MGTIDNAGCHPPQLNNILDYVEVKYLPANTTALIQPMDQGVIHVFKLNYLDIYYNKMIDYLLRHSNDDDPMMNFPSTYTMKDVLIDIGHAWDRVEEQHIHKCFEKLIIPDDYLKQWNETNEENLQWPGLNFRGFQDPPNDNSATERADRLKKINELVSGLQTKIDTLPERQRVIIDRASVEEAIHYDPNDDLENTKELITLGFLSQREEEGLQSEDNDRDIPQMAHEALKALASIGITFRPDDFKSKEAAEQASTYLKGLQKIFLEQKNPITSTIPTQPRPASGPPSPQATTSGVTTIRPRPASGPPSPQASTSGVTTFRPRPASRPPSPQRTTSGVTTIRPSPVRSVPAENESLESLEVMEIINVTLDYEGESDADGDADGNATDGDAADGDADAADGDAADGDADAADGDADGDAADGDDDDADDDDG